MAAEQPDATRSGDAANAEPEFQTVWRGFDPEQVRARLKQVTGRLEEAESRLDRTQRLLEDARRERDLARTAAGLESYEGVSSHVVDLVRQFDQDVEALRRKAEAEATGIVAEARSEAARLRIEMQVEEQDARAKAEELLRATRDEAERLRAELEPVREATLNQIRAMRDRLASSVRELDRILNPEPAEQRVVVIDEADEVAPANDAAPVHPQETPTEPVM